MSDTSARRSPATESIQRQKRDVAGVPRVVVTQGPSIGKIFVLTKARATIGRHDTNDLVLADPRVSATHVELERREEGRLVARDLGTTNGTWMGPHRIYEVELAPGALLRIGDSAVRVEIDDRAEPEHGSTTGRFGDLAGVSPEMRELFATLERLAATDAPILAQGEAGAGKEELARAVHAASPRKHGPFVVLDVATIPAPFAESVLFGHEPQAFPGADARHAGAFERARGGTLFIDDIAELSLDLQAKLLTVLETKQIHRVGGADEVPVDFRLIAATNRDLRVEIEQKRFRDELFYRFADSRVYLPPLRGRVADIPLLAERFLAEIAASASGESVSLSKDGRITISELAMKNLLERKWPGNVRELRSVLARAASVCQDGVILPVDLAGDGFGFRGLPTEREVIDLNGTFSEAKDRAIARFEYAYLGALVRRCGGNLSKASRQADIARNHLRALLKKRGLYDPGDT